MRSVMIKFFWKILKRLFKWPYFLFIILIVVLVYLLLVIGPSAVHKNVSEQFKSSFLAEECYQTNEGSERILCIDDNTEALLWRLRVIEDAQEEIIFSTFEMRDDNSGRDIMAALYFAAKRGVHILLLMDGLPSYLNLHRNANFKALTANENVEAKFYNPINLAKPWKLNFRLHDKYLIADDNVYILGGRNTYDLFLGDYSDKVNIDRDILVCQSDRTAENSSLIQLKAYFEKVWNLSDCKEFVCKKNTDKVKKAAAFLQEHYKWVQSTYPQAYEETDYFAATIPTNKITILTNPPEAKIRQPSIWYMLQQLMMGQDDVIIQTPYIVCSGGMYRDLTDICKTSKKVEIITNAVESGANPFGCTDYLNQKNKILKTGLTVNEFLGDDSIHVKTLLINGRLSVVGSYNLDMRSTYLDTEMMLAIDCPQLNEQLRIETAENKEKSKQVSPEGTIKYGSKYQAVNLTPGKKIFYQFFRFLIKPFRYLL